MACETGVIGEFVSNGEPHADQAAFPYRNTFFNNTTASYKTASFNGGIAVKNGPCGNMALVCYGCVVSDQCAGVDDAVVTHPDTDIDDCPVHDNAARANCGVARDMGGGRDDDRQLKPALRGLLIKARRCSAVCICLTVITAY